VVFVMGVTCVYSVYDQQFSVYFASMFENRQEGNAMYGYLNSFQVFLEAGGMFLAPFLVIKIGAKNSLIVSGLIMAIRMIGSGFADDTITISLMKLLHAVELPIMLVAIFKYITQTFDARMSATLYIVGFQFSTQITASGLSIFAGMMYDNLGFPLSYKILGAIVLFFTIISYFLLSSKQPVPNKQSIA
jgi:MFS transporter, OHS family, lactose permease